MKLRIIALLGCLGFAMWAHANEVLLTSNQPLKITFRVVHKNENGQPVFGRLQSIDLSKNVTVQAPLNNHDRSGITVVCVNGHDKQCSITYILSSFY